MSKDPVKVTVNLSDDVLQALKELARTRGTTMTEVVHQAISTEKYLDEEQRQGAKVLLREASGETKQLVFRGTRGSGSSV